MHAVGARYREVISRSTRCPGWELCPLINTHYPTCSAAVVDSGQVKYLLRLVALTCEVGWLFSECGGGGHWTGLLAPSLTLHLVEWPLAPGSCSCGLILRFVCLPSLSVLIERLGSGNEQTSSARRNLSWWNLPAVFFFPFFCQKNIAWNEGSLLLLWVRVVFHKGQSVFENLKPGHHSFVIVFLNGPRHMETFQTCTELWIIPWRSPDGLYVRTQMSEWEALEFLTRLGVDYVSNTRQTLKTKIIQISQDEKAVPYRRQRHKMSR